MLISMYTRYKFMRFATSFRTSFLNREKSWWAHITSRIHIIKCRRCGAGSVPAMYCKMIYLEGLK